MSRLRLRVEGQPGSISLTSYLAIMNNALAVLKDLDKSVSEGPPSVDWVVTSLGVSSLMTDLRSKPIKEDGLEVAPRVAAAFIGGLNALQEEAALPPLFSIPTVRRLQKITDIIGKDGARGFKVIDLDDGSQGSTSPEFTANLTKVLAPKYVALGSAIGRIELVNLHKKRPTYHVYRPNERRSIECQFGIEHMEEVRQGLGKRVLVSGLMFRNAKGEPVRLEDAEIRIIPENLPETILGLDTNFTGDLTTEEHLKELRDGT